MSSTVCLSTNPYIIHTYIAFYIFFTPNKPLLTTKIPLSMNHKKLSQVTALFTTIRIPLLSPKTVITPQLLFTLPIFPTINYLRVLLNNDICTTHTSVAFHLPLHNPFAHIQRIQITYFSHFLSLQTPTIISYSL